MKQAALKVTRTKPRVNDIVMHSKGYVRLTRKGWTVWYPKGRKA